MCVDDRARGIVEFERAVADLRDELAERDVIHPPAWARDTFGERPADSRGVEQWDRGVRAIARHRVEYDVAGLGPEPDAPHARNSWRQADQTVRQVERRLGHIEPERTIDRER